MRRMTRQPRTQRRLLTWHGAILVICASIVLSTWALASPPGSSPDDEFHLASIWCATGVGSTTCPQENDGEVLLPKAIAVAPGQGKPCFVPYPDTSGLCLFTGNTNELVPHSEDRINSGAYPPVYYRVMHGWVSSHAVASATLMRLFNGALAVALLFATLAIARPATRRAHVLSTILAQMTRIAPCHVRRRRWVRGCRVMRRIMGVRSRRQGESRSPHDRCTFAYAPKVPV